MNKQTMKYERSKMIRTIWNLTKVTLTPALILFVVALFSPVKAVYILNITLSYLYIVLASLGSFIVQYAIKLIHGVA